MTTAEHLTTNSGPRRMLALTVVLALLAAATLAFGAARSSAYEGIFCSPVNLSDGEFCPSSEVSDIRRAIGHSSTGGYTLVEVSTNVGYKSNACGSSDCTADTGYLSADGTGRGFIEDIRSGRYTFHGYLYP
jgi:hypothetical protein